MSKWNLVIDVEKCNGCFNCFIACKDEHVGNAFPGYSAEQPLHGHKWIDIKTVERGQTPMLDLTYLPTMCNHCDDAPCVKAGKGAVRKREDGIVLFDPERTRDRKDLVASCPYGAIWWNEQERVPQTWFFDAHLLDRGWKQPRCVQACGLGAMRSMKVEDDEMQRVVREESLEVLKPELGTKPRVYYRNLYHVQRCFIGGTVIAEANGVQDAVKNARVVLSKDGKVVGETLSDPYGDFSIDGLPPTSGTYAVEVSAPGYKAEKRDAVLGESRYLGVMQLKKA